MLGPYEVVFTRSARRALELELPEKVAAAAFEFIMGPLREDPRRVGKSLREPLAPLYSARRGEYRVIYRIVDRRLVIEVVSIVHRRDAYRSRGGSAFRTERNRMADPDRRSTLLDAYENAAVIVSGIGADELGNPTPCSKYDVAGMIDHLVEAGHRAAALGRGQAPPAGDESPHVELSEAPGQLRSTADRAAQAWSDDFSLSVRHTMPWGEEYPGATLVDMCVAELATHAWDLARATGQINMLDPSLAVPAIEGARAWIKPQYRNLVEPGAPFGSEVDPAPGADDWERLAAFMGRDPRTALGL